MKHTDIPREQFDENFMFVQNTEDGKSLFVLKQDAERFDAGEMDSVELYYAYFNKDESGVLLQPSGQFVKQNN